MDSGLAVSPRPGMTRSGRHGTAAASGHGGAGDRRHLCLHGARGRHDLPGYRPPEFRSGRDGDVLDLYCLAGHAVGSALLGRFRRGGRSVVYRGRADRAGAVQADPQRPGAQQPGCLHRPLQHPEQRRRLSLGLHDQDFPDAVMLIAPVVFLEPNMMLGVLLYGFAGAVLGGLTSPGGAVLGGFAVGVIENVAGTFIPYVGRELKLTIALVLIVAVLMVRPSGLFGRSVVSRV